MCISFWLLDEHPSYWLVLALNRDEFHSRPSLPIHQWQDHGDGRIVAGRDALGGGTWLGVTTTGRLAFVTNVREGDRRGFGDEQRPGIISRGALTTSFLTGTDTPREYLQQVAREASSYNGFNLVVADFARKEMAFLSNRPKGESPPKLQTLSPGLHSLSNGRLNSKWWKMERGKDKMASILSQLGDGELPNEVIVEEVLQDPVQAQDVSLQVSETNASVELERVLSSIFVSKELGNEHYGTRSMSVVGVRRDGSVSFFERSLESREWRDHKLSFSFQNMQP